MPLIINLSLALIFCMFLDKKNMDCSKKKRRKIHLYMSCILLFFFSFIVAFHQFQHLLAAFSLSLIPGGLPLVIYDIYHQYLQEKQQKQLVSFLMVLSKWSNVKNDLVYCLQKAERSDLEKPICTYLSDAVGRIERGMDVKEAIQLMEQDALGEDFSYMIRNIQISAQKGGDLSLLFKNMEEQFFRVNEETYKRKISTFRDRMFVYITMGMVAWVIIFFMFSNPTAQYFYFHTTMGKNLIALLALLFFVANLFYSKK